MSDSEISDNTNFIISENDETESDQSLIMSKNDETESDESIDPDVEISNNDYLFINKIRRKKSPVIISESEDDDHYSAEIVSNLSVKSPLKEPQKDSALVHSFKKIQLKNNQIIDDSDEDPTSKMVPNLSVNSPLKETQKVNTPVHSFKKVQLKKNQIIDDSDEDYTPTKMMPHLSVNSLIMETQKNGENNPQVLHDSFKKVQTKKNGIIESDSDEEQDRREISQSDSENDNIDSEQFFATNKLLSSTLLNEKPITPRNLVTGKRLLNKSFNTPKTFKQSKDSNTPRQVSQIILSSSEETDNDDGDSDDIIDISDEKPSTSKIPAKVKEHQMENIIQKNTEQSNPNLIEVSQKEYRDQSDKVNKVQNEYRRINGLLKQINLELLPDKGVSLRKRAEMLEKTCTDEVLKLSKMKITKPNLPTKPQNKVPSWNDIEAGTGAVVPRTFGKQALATINTERQLTVDRLQQLHGSLQSCPKESDLAEQPKGLKVELMIHQKRALSWLMWREHQKPSGGILADDMGLGKTLTMISLLLMYNDLNLTNDDEEEENQLNKSNKFNGGTLVVCPASLINQWSGEIERRTKRGLISCEVYHGAKRETKAKRLAKHDMVITTYSIVNIECEKNGAIFKVKWRRLIIDEAHQIRNHKSQTSDAVCRLSAKSRWALTGTPVQNKELDMYALMKYLRCTPFDDIKVWKRWVGEKSTGGSERLHTVISSLMLRRTKVELMEKGLLNTMPERKWELVEINLTESERGVYSKFLIFSRTLFAQFLHQRAEKNQDALNANYDINSATGPNQEYFLMRQKLLRMNKLKDIKQHEILVLLLRLRQICCHLSLITGMLQEDNDMQILGNEEEDYDKSSAIDLLDQLNKLTLADKNDSENVAEGLGAEASTLRDVAKSVLKPSDPIFSKTAMSSKINALIKLLQEKIIPSNDKAIIVSQWSSFLLLIGYHLKTEGLKFEQLDGQVPVHKRMEMVDRFNNPKDPIKVLLLSLTAGGVGLNLVGANHLILLDLHWNPQLENQAQDRIYRVGQEKPVFVYKFMATDTIEKRILDLQEKKLDIANSMLTGSNQASKNKLTLQDLKMLFDM